MRSRLILVAEKESDVTPFLFPPVIPPGAPPTPPPPPVGCLGKLGLVGIAIGVGAGAGTAANALSDNVARGIHGGDAGDDRTSDIIGDWLYWHFYGGANAPGMYNPRP